MFSSIEAFISLRYLRTKRKEVFISIITIISVLGVALSVMVLNIVLSVMTGFETELKAKLIDANAHIIVRQHIGYMVNHQSIIDKVKTVPGVISAFPYTYNQAMISESGRARGIIVRGVADDVESRKKLASLTGEDAIIDKLFQKQIIDIARPDGSNTTAQLPPLLIGESLRQNLAIAPQGIVSLFSPELTASPQGLIPRTKRFYVVDVYRSGLMEYESSVAYTSVEAAQQFFDLGSAVTGVELVVDDVFKVQALTEKVLDVLGGASSPYFATDWTEPNRALWEALQLEKREYFIVLLLLILVASFSIISTLVMVVMEKTKDIAILKSLGASDRSILKIFLLQGAIIGTSGVVFGSLLGLLGCLALRSYGFPIDESVFSLDTVPVQIEFSNFLLVAGSGLIITILAGVYPAYRAASLKPAEALRYE